MTTSRRSQPLYRDPHDSMIGGVCSGLGHYFDVDTVLIRVAFIVVALLGGGGVLAYLILWAVLDPAPPGHLHRPGEAESPPLGSSGPIEDLRDTIDLDTGDLDTGDLDPGDSAVDQPVDQSVPPAERSDELR